MPNALIKVEKLSLGYGKTPIISDLNLTVFEDEFITIVGPNGSGKSTFIKTLLGALPKISGHIETSLKSFGYVPQHAQLNTSMPITGREFFNLKPHSEADLEKIESLLGINKNTLLDTPIHELSVGQRQRLLVAFALIGKPKLIVLDEATDGLDFKAQKEFFQLLKTIQKETHATIILISHDISAVGDYSTRVLCLNRSLLYDGAPNSPEFHSCLHSIYGKDSFIHDHHHHKDQH